MKRWLLIVLLFSVVLLAVGMAFWPEDVLDADFSAVTPEFRKQIDARALELPDDPPEENEKTAYGTVGTWLLARTPLPLEEEFKRAQAAHDKLMRKMEVVPTPESAARIFKQLIAELPNRMKPDPYRFTLTVLDTEESRSWSGGGGFVYITQPYLESLLLDTKEGRHRLAFVLAHELGHICRGHDRMRYQLEMAEDELRQRGADKIELRRIRELLGATVESTGEEVIRLHSREEDYQADLFGLHLCRNAEFDTEIALDVLRLSAVQEDSKTGRREPDSEDGNADSEWTNSLARLKLLRRELDGIPAIDRYGLYTFDRADGRLSKSTDRSITSGTKAVVFVHGMESGTQVFDTAMQELGNTESADDTAILALSYPADASLALVGKFLAREMERVFVSAERADFVCHSAGGLVFRHYAEIEQGGFHRALFLATPHEGSDLAKLRQLLELKQFFGDLNLGYSAALSEALTDGRGQIGFDLQPDSLFLRNLNRAESPTGRYTVFRGRAVSFLKAITLRAAVTAARAALSTTIETTAEPGLWKDAGLEWIDGLRLPTEVTSGDLAVTLESAALNDANDIRTFSLNHTEIPQDADVIDGMVELLRSTDE